MRAMVGSLWRLRFARFLIIGALNTLFGFGVFYLLLLAHLRPGPALAVATVLGVLFNFMTTGRVVFENAEGCRLWRFAGVALLVFVVNGVALEGAMRLGLGAAAAQALLLLPCVILSYALNRAFVFATAPEASKA